MPEEYHPFAPRVLNFEEAFPQITDVVIEVEESGKLPRSSSGFRSYSKNDLKERIHCMNIQCDNRGFSSEAILRDMVRHNEQERVTTARCEGRERIRRSQTRACTNYFRVTVTITYNDGQQEAAENLPA